MSRSRPFPLRAGGAARLLAAVALALSPTARVTAQPPSVRFVPGLRYAERPLDAWIERFEASGRRRSRFVASDVEAAARALADDPDPFVAAAARSVAADRGWGR